MKELNFPLLRSSYYKYWEDIARTSDVMVRFDIMDRWIELYVEIVRVLYSDSKTDKELLCYDVSIIYDYIEKELK